MERYIIPRLRWVFNELPDVKRRTTKSVPETVAPVAAVTAGMKPKVPVQSAPSKATVEDVKQEKRQETKKQPALGRQSSNIAASFAKTQPPKTAQASKNGESLLIRVFIVVVPMADEDDDDEAMDDEFALDNPEAKEKAAASRLKREQDEATLRDMMEQDDAEEVASKSKTSKDQEEDEGDDVEMADAEEQESAADQEPAAEVKAVATTPGPHQPGRRRGKRLVTKKKTTRDAEGYLVTREEQAWESFSEEDKPAPKPIVAPLAASKKAAATATGKKGQGNIMSFFGKKS